MTIEVGSVWAPEARSVDLVLDGRSLRLLAMGGGVFGPPDGVADRFEHGFRYGFRLDGGDVLADPRSRWQPDGPDGLSAVDDADSFDWHDAGFEAEPWPRALVYELHVGTFGEAGTFAGVIDHLDHLVALGVTHVELMPIGAWVGRWGWGYDGVCWWAPHAPYGTPADLRSLVDACHNRGLAVILDVVFNHLGPQGAVLDRFGPYTRAAETPWGRAVNFDGDGCERVREMVVDCGLMWLRDQHIDGLRLDAVHAIEDRSRRHVVAELTARVDDLSVEVGRDLMVIAEWDRHDPVPVIDRRDGGWGCRAQWADDLHHALHVTLTSERGGYYADAAVAPDPIDEALDAVYIPRRATGDPATERIAAGIGRAAFVVCVQNHDQVGNRAGGERITALAPLDAVMAALPLVLLGPSVPLLFQGEEWAASSPFPFFADHDPAMSEIVLRGRRAEFPDDPAEAVADPGAQATFLSARLPWAEPDEGRHAAVLGWYRTLVELRRTHPELTAGRPFAVHRPAGAPGVHLLERGPVLVACNLGPAAWVPADLDGSEPGGRTVASWPADITGAVALRPASALVIHRDRLGRLGR